MMCDGQASYKLPIPTRRDIKQFATDHNILGKVSDHAAEIFDIFLCMLAVEFKMNDEHVAHRRIPIDFATPLRHQKLLAFAQEHITRITGFYLHDDIYHLTFYLGVLVRPQWSSFQNNLL